MNPLESFIEATVERSVQKAVEKALGTLLVRIGHELGGRAAHAPKPQAAAPAAKAPAAKAPAKKAAHAAPAPGRRGPGRPKKGTGPSHTEKIVSFFEAHDVGAIFAPSEVGEACGLAGPAVNNALKRLVDTKVLQRTGVGQYQLIPTKHPQGGEPAPAELTLEPPPVTAAPDASSHDIVIEDDHHAISDPSLLNLAENYAPGNA
jgi:hypothetical protein